MTLNWPQFPCLYLDDNGPSEVVHSDANQKIMFHKGNRLRKLHCQKFTSKGPAKPHFKREDQALTENQEYFFGCRLPNKGLNTFLETYRSDNELTGGLEIKG